MNNKFSLKTNLWGFTVLGILFVIQGIYHIMSGMVFPFGLIIGIILVPGGIVYSVYGLLAFSKSSKYAPRVEVDSGSLVFKNGVLKEPKTIRWNKIKQIEFASSRLVFSMPDSEYAFLYDTQAETSKEIKSTIREMAESKQIKVTGG
ncbi:MAG: hypothetical protein RLO17_16785 [Cyclobacteriaceae bacterium]